MKKGNVKAKGFTLVELLLVVGLVGMGVGAIYVLNDITGHSNDAFQEAQRLANYSKTAYSIASSSGDFSNINIQYLENYGVNVDRKLGLSKIVSPNPTHLSFEYENIDSKFCTKFISNVLATGTNFQIQINDTNLDEKTEVIANAAALCAQGKSKIVITQSTNVAMGTLTDDSLIPAYSYNTGNPGTITNAGLNPLSPIEIVAGQSSSSFVRNDSGSGFNGGVSSGNPGAVAPPNVSTPPPDFSSAGDDLKIPATPLPPGKVSQASIDFKVDTNNLINIQTLDMNVVVNSLYPYSRYRLEFVSQAFSLSNNNPVVVGDLSGSNGLVDELTMTFEANAFGAISYKTAEKFNVSHYFQKVIGTDGNGQPITNPNEPMNASLKDFFQNTIKNYSMTVDVIATDSEKLVTSFDFMPTWHMESPFITNLRKYNLQGNRFTQGCINCGVGSPYTFDLASAKMGDEVKPNMNKWSFTAVDDRFTRYVTIDFEIPQDWADFTGEGYRIYYIGSRVWQSGRGADDFLICKLPTKAYTPEDSLSYTCK